MKYSLNHKIVIYIILSLSVVIVSLTNEKWQSIPMLVALYCSPLLMFCNWSYKKQYNLLLIVALLLFSTYFFHPNEFRLSTILYSCMFFMQFVAYEGILEKNDIPIDSIRNIVSAVIKAYALVLIIQQGCSYVGLPVINASYNISVVGLKQGSLAMEPSGIGPVLTILFYAYTKLSEVLLKRPLSLKECWHMDKLLVMSYFYCCLFCGSIASIVAFIALLAYFLELRNLIKILIGFLLLYFIVMIANPELFQRMSLLLTALYTLDVQAIYETDSSASARIAPYLVYIKEFDAMNINTWFGYGCDYGGIHVFSYLANTDVESDGGMGGIINFLYDYGLIVGFLFIVFVSKYTKFNTYTFWLYIMVYSIYSINHYITWLFMIMVCTIHHYEKQCISNKSNSFNGI